MDTLSPQYGVRIHLLGEFSVCVGPTEIEHGSWRLRKVRSLVKLLALATGHRLHREHVCELLWPDLDPGAAANNLHQALHIARRALALPFPPDIGGACFHFRDQILTLDPPTSLWVDVEAFQTAASAAQASSDAAAYERALTLYRGDLLPDDRYEEWADERRDELRQQHMSLLSGLAAAHEHAGELPRAIETLREIVAREPSDEGACVKLMRLYARLGQRQAAKLQFQRLEDALRDLDAAPDSATARLLDQILSGTLPAEQTRVGAVGLVGGRGRERHSSDWRDLNGKRFVRSGKASQRR